MYVIFSKYFASGKTEDVFGIMFTKSEKNTQVIDSYYVASSCPYFFAPTCKSTIITLVLSTQVPLVYIFLESVWEGNKASLVFQSAY